MFDNHDVLAHLTKPIAALCTGRSGSAITMFRLSGKLSHSYALGFLRFDYHQITLDNITNFHAQALRCKIIDPNNCQIIDDGVSIFFCAPRSYTGENTVELFLHGGSYIIEKTLEIFWSQGFRQAMPGEFTQIAYLNNKMDLTQAEGINQLSSASCESEWRVARYLTSGDLSDHLCSIRGELLSLLADFEACLDFPEESDVLKLSRSGHIDKACVLNQKLIDLIKSYKSAKISSEGLKITMIGKPNAGKSTLINTLSNQQRSIVTDHPGTTRDYLQASYLYHGYKLNVFDTAGLRYKTKDLSYPEQLAIKKSLQLMFESDLICVVNSIEDDHCLQLKNYLEHYQLQSIDKLPSIINILSKCDLDKPIPDWASDCLLVSAHAKDHKNSKYQRSIEKLQKKFTQEFYRNNSKLENIDFIATVRQKTAVMKAQAQLDKFIKDYHRPGRDDILAFYLQNCANYLQSIIGKITSDQLLEEVFSKFCIGK